MADWTWKWVWKKKSCFLPNYISTFCLIVKNLWVVKWRTDRFLLIRRLTCTWKRNHKDITLSQWMVEWGDANAGCRRQGSKCKIIDILFEGSLRKPALLFTIETCVAEIMLNHDHAIVFICSNIYVIPVIGRVLGVTCFPPPWFINWICHPPAELSINLRLSMEIEPCRY